MKHIPSEVKKRAHLMYQEMMRGPILPSQMRTLAILEKIAYLELGDIHREVKIESKPVIIAPQPSHFNQELEHLSFEIDRNNILEMLKNNKKLASLILDRFKE